MRKIFFTAVLAGAMLTSAAIAQHSGHQPPPKSGQGTHDGHQGMHGTPQKGNNAPSTAAFQAANMKMHQAMDIPFTGDADRDFVAGMIAHHQGAIDMANVVIKFGKDPGVRKLAEEIIQAQEKEIAWMKDWLAKNAK